jgi:predicted O-methyltransferase YrrM
LPLRESNESGIEFRRVLPVGDTPDELVGFSIDQPRTGSVEDGLLFFVSGWVLARESSVRSVQVLAEDRLLAEGLVDRPRPDLARIYGGAETRAGFRLPVGVFDLPREFQLIVTAQLDDGRGVQLAEIDASHELLVGSQTGDGSPARASPNEGDSERGAGWDTGTSMETEGEALELLSGLVWATKPDLVVETGTFTGRGTKAILKALETNGKGHLHTVEFDPQLASQLERLQLSRLTFHSADSNEWCEKEAPSEIDIAFVDSGGRDIRVADVRGLWPKIRREGFLVVHDTTFHAGLYEGVCGICGDGLAIPTLNGLGIWQRR